MSKIYLITAFLFSVSVYPQTEKNNVVQIPEALKIMVPEGWQPLALAEGDLNKDGIADAALVIEENRADNFILNDGLGAEVLNTNARRLLILVREEGGGEYRIESENDEFIPPANTEDSPCLDDPFLASELSIIKGVLTVNLHYWSSCGSYGVTNKTYKFRFWDKEFTLIGFDLYDFSRSMGEITEVSINFLTKKKSVTSGANEFYPELHNPVTKWTTIKMEKLLTLEDLHKDTEIAY